MFDVFLLYEEHEPLPHQGARAHLVSIFLPFDTSEIGRIPLTLLRGLPDGFDFNLWSNEQFNAARGGQNYLNMQQVAPPQPHLSRFFLSPHTLGPFVAPLFTPLSVYVSFHSSRSVHLTCTVVAGAAPLRELVRTGSANR